MNNILTLGVTPEEDVHDLPPTTPPTKKREFLYDHALITKGKSGQHEIKYDIRR